MKLMNTFSEHPLFLITVVALKEDSVESNDEITAKSANINSTVIYKLGEEKIL